MIFLHRKNRLLLLELADSSYESVPVIDNGPRRSLHPGKAAAGQREF